VSWRRGEARSDGVGTPQKAKFVAEDSDVGELVGEGDVCYKEE
jgi:hypothetical protein